MISWWSAHTLLDSQWLQTSGNPFTDGPNYYLQARVVSGGDMAANVWGVITHQGRDARSHDAWGHVWSGVVIDAVTCSPVIVLCRLYSCSLHSALCRQASSISRRSRAVALNRFFASYSLLATAFPHDICEKPVHACGYITLAISINITNSASYDVVSYTSTGFFSETTSFQHKTETTVFARFSMQNWCQMNPTS